MSRLFKSGGSGYSILKIHQEKIDSLVNQGMYSYDIPKVKEVEDKNKKEKKKKNVNVNVKLIDNKKDININLLNKKREEEALGIIKRLHSRRYTCRAIARELEKKGYTTGGIPMYSQKNIMSILLTFPKRNKTKTKSI